MFTGKRTNFGFLTFKVTVSFLVFVFVVVMSPNLFARGYCGSKFCSKTATAAYKAGLKEAWDDYWIAVGNCYNLSDQEARDNCLEEAEEERIEAIETCRDQREARCDICDELGEEPYDPEINPDDFVDFQKIIDGEESLTPNPYFPLEPGTTWEYLTMDVNGDAIEMIKVEVLEETKEILDVNCIVVRDRVWEIEDEGNEVTLVEDTVDWYAQDTEGNVWYFGEIAQEFEDEELVSLEGSWKAGRDYAKPGYLMLANPQEGVLYRQEFALGEAEDMGEVVSRDEESVTVPFGEYDDDVLKTLDFTPIEPDVFEFKYYALGVGLVLEVNIETGERVELIDMTTP